MAAGVADHQGDFAQGAHHAVEEVATGGVGEPCCPADLATGNLRERLRQHRLLNKLCGSHFAFEVLANRDVGNGRDDKATGGVCHGR